MSQVSAATDALSQQKRTATNTRRIQSLPSPLGKHPARREATSRYLLILWKDQLDATSHWLKRAFFWAVYRPFIHFCRFQLKLPTFCVEECCRCKRRLLWLEFEQIVDDKWQAEQAAETPNWGWYEVPTTTPLPTETLVGFVDQDYPLADAKTRDRYQRNGHSTIELPRVDLVKLAGKIAQTDSLVEQFHSKAT